LQFLDALRFVVYLSLSVFVWARNPDALLNRVCSGALLRLAVWSFRTIFLHDPRTSKEQAALYEHVASMGWIGISSFTLWFLVVYAGKRRILRSPLFYAVLPGVPLRLIYQQMKNGALIGEYVLHSYRWAGKCKESIYSCLYFACYFTFTRLSKYLACTTFRLVVPAGMKDPGT